MKTGQWKLLDINIPVPEWFVRWLMPKVYADLDARVDVTGEASRSFGGEAANTTIIMKREPLKPNEQSR